MRRKYDEGFTLIELVVTIVTASIVTLAATTVLLLGLRLTRESRGTVSQQSTVRIMLSAMERMVTEGTIKGIKPDLDAWDILGENEKVLFHYDSKSGKITSGDSTVLMEGVIASSLNLNGDLLDLSVETAEGTYSSSVYCRTVEIEEKKSDEAEKVEQDVKNDKVVMPEEMDPNEKTGRLVFAAGLLSQLGSTGMSIEDGKPSEYYSYWYSKDLETPWPPETPWCACYISWVLANRMDNLPEGVNVPKSSYANVDYWRNDLQKGIGGTWEFSQAMWMHPDNDKQSTDPYIPITGDLIFFDWTVDVVEDPEHVGVVLMVDQKNGYVFTIEGNSSNRVAMRKYPINDMRILGYGVLNWAK